MRTIVLNMLHMKFTVMNRDLCILSNNIGTNSSSRTAYEQMACKLRKSLNNLFVTVSNYCVNTAIQAQKTMMLNILERRFEEVYHLEYKEL